MKIIKRAPKYLVSSISTVILAATGFAAVAQASEIHDAEIMRQSLIETSASKEEFNYSNYYQVKAATGDKVNLLDLEKIQKKFPKPSEAYNRTKHFGGWIRGSDGDNSCLNTRSKVLVRDSVSNVTYANSGCSVQSGDWDDPYSAIEIKQAHDVQIDHFVPLKNAYMTGAYQWDFNKRCLYANFLANKFHLLAVSGHENISKSDSSPAEYMPPNKSYTCQYLKQWLLVKTIWGLKITPMEGEAINNAIVSGRCNRADFVTSESFIKNQQQYIDDHADLCAKAQISSFDSEL